MNRKPFIKLFQTPNSYYCFDVNRNEMVELEKTSFQYLKQIMNGGEPQQDMPEELIRAKDAGYFSEESNVKHVMHTVTEYISDFLERRMLKLTL